MNDGKRVGLVLLVLLVGAWSCGDPPRSGQRGEGAGSTGGTGGGEPRPDPLFEAHSARFGGVYEVSPLLPSQLFVTVSDTDDACLGSAVPPPHGLEIYLANPAPGAVCPIVPHNSDTPPGEPCSAQVHYVETNEDWSRYVVGAENGAVQLGRLESGRIEFQVRGQVPVEPLSEDRGCTQFVWYDEEGEHLGEIRCDCTSREGEVVSSCPLESADQPNCCNEGKPRRIFEMSFEATACRRNSQCMGTSELYCLGDFEPDAGPANPPPTDCAAVCRHHATLCDDCAGCGGNPDCQLMFTCTLSEADCLDTCQQIAWLPQVVSAAPCLATDRCIDYATCLLEGTLPPI